jgi:DNA mismatch repair protein MutS2
VFKKIDPFIEILPQLDVHGYTRDIVTTVVNDFIYEQYRMGKEKIMVIHGKSGGVLKKAIHDCLKRNKYVKNYYLYNMNIGCTIIELNKERG